MTGTLVPFQALKVSSLCYCEQAASVSLQALASAHELKDCLGCTSLDRTAQISVDARASEPARGRSYELCPFTPAEAEDPPPVAKAETKKAARRMARLSHLHKPTAVDAVSYGLQNLWREHLTGEV